MSAIMIKKGSALRHSSLTEHPDKPDAPKPWLWRFHLRIKLKVPTEFSADSQSKVFHRFHLEQQKPAAAAKATCRLLRRLLLIWTTTRLRLRSKPVRLGQNNQNSPFLNTDAPNFEKTYWRQQAHHVHVPGQVDPSKTKERQPRDNRATSNLKRQCQRQLFLDKYIKTTFGGVPIGVAIPPMFAE